jgi:hypothetical protein
MAPEQDRPPPRLVYTLPGADAVAVRRDAPYTDAGEPDLLLDVYAPPAAGPADRRPVVLFVHGGPGLERPLSVKDSPWYTGWGRLVAAAAQEVEPARSGRSMR